MTKSQYDILSEELNKVLLLISDKEIERILPLIELFLSESNVFGDHEEIDEPDQRHPVEILKGQLFPINDNNQLAKWNVILSLYLSKQIAKRNQRNNLKLVDYALHALNVSKTFRDKAKDHSKLIAIEIKKSRAKTARRSNAKRYSPLDILKEAAFREYEPAIRELQARNNRKRTMITYWTIASIVYPVVDHLNKDSKGHKCIGRNGDPVTSLADIFQDAVTAKVLKSTRHYRKNPLSV